LYAYRFGDVVDRVFSTLKRTVDLTDISPPPLPSPLFEGFYPNLAKMIRFFLRSASVKFASSVYRFFLFSFPPLSRSECGKTLFLLTSLLRRDFAGLSLSP